MDLSAGELLGLAAVIGLITGALAVCVSPVLVERLRRRLDTHHDKAEAYGRWLAARLAFSKSSKAFVTNFRSIDRDPAHAPAPEELQRAEETRQRWLAALTEWELQTGNLLMRCDDAHIGTTLRAFESPDAQSIRTSIGKTSADVDRLFAQLDELDAVAIYVVRDASKESRSSWWGPVERVWNLLRRIVDRLSKP